MVCAVPAGSIDLVADFKGCYRLGAAFAAAEQSNEILILSHGSGHSTLPKPKVGILTKI